MLTLHKPKSKTYDITTIRTPSDSHLHWKNLFHKNPLYFRTNAGFEADNEIDNSNIVDKTTNIQKQIPVNSFKHKESELDDILQSGY